MKMIGILFFIALTGLPVYAQIPSPTPPNVTEPVVTPETLPEPEQPSKKDRKLKYSLSAFYSLGSSFNFNSATVISGGSTGTVSGNFNSGNAPGLSAEITNSIENRWGWLGGASYELSRNINSFTVTGPGGSATGIYTSTTPSVSILILYADGIYRWKSLYMPLGLNFNVPFFQNGVGATGTTSFSGGVGFQVGAGYFLNDNFSFELELQYLTFTGSTSSGGTAVNFNTITFVDPLFKLKYTF